MTPTYIDSGLLVKSYIEEANSREVDLLLRKLGTPFVFSHFHEIEVPNAIRLKRFRKEINKEQEKVAVMAFQADVDSGRLERPKYNLGDVFLRAEKLSANYSGIIGSRIFAWQ